MSLEQFKSIKIVPVLSAHNLPFRNLLGDAQDIKVSLSQAELRLASTH